MTAHTIPEGFWQDAKGNLVPASKVKEHHKLEDELVRRFTSSAETLSEALRTFKVQALTDAQAFREVVAEQYGATKGGAKGNMTLRSYDGTLEMQVSVGETLSFGPELQAAKELIDNCIARWSEGGDDNIRALVNDAFQVGKAGRIDTHRILSLRRLEFADEEWKRAMDAISDAVRVTASKTYLRLYTRDPETEERTPISLDLATV